MGPELRIAVTEVVMLPGNWGGEGRYMVQIAFYNWNQYFMNGKFFFFLMGVTNCLQLMTSDEPKTVT